MWEERKKQLCILSIPLQRKKIKAKLCVGPSHKISRKQIKVWLLRSQCEHVYLCFCFVVFFLREMFWRTLKVFGVSNNKKRLENTFCFYSRLGKEDLQTRQTEAFQPLMSLSCPRTSSQFCIRVRKLHISYRGVRSWAGTESEHQNHIKMDRFVCYTTEPFALSTSWS